MNPMHRDIEVYGNPPFSRLAGGLVVVDSVQIVSALSCRYPYTRSLLFAGKELG
jgi:hypothetical protein